MSDEMVAFLRARLDEVQAAAWTAREGPLEERWHAKGYDQVVQRGYRSPEVLGEPHLIADCGPMGFTRVRHIVLHDPAQVLREVKASRRLLERLDDAATALEVATGTVLAGAARLKLTTLRECAADFAAVWSDHPDYRQAWKPRISGTPQRGR